MCKKITFLFYALTFFAFITGCSEEFDDKNMSLWEKMSELQDKRMQPATVLHDSTDFYVLGGFWYYSDESALRIFTNVDIYDSINDRWRAVPPLERGLAGAFSISIGGKIYVGGGYYEEAGGIKQFNLKLLSYDPILNTWDYTLPDLPESKVYSAIASFQNKIYIFGGINFDWNTNTSTLSNTILEYNVYTKSWVQLNKTLNFPRADAKAIEHNGSIYIIGGGNKWIEGNSKQALANVEKLNLSTFSITNIEMLPENKLNFAIVKHNDLIYVFGGYNEELIRSTKTCVLDTKTETWIVDDRYQLDFATGDFDAFLINGKLYFYVQPSYIYKFRLEFPIDYINY